MTQFSRSLALLVFGCVLAAAPASGQEACPQASGADAEAGWSAYAAGDMSAAEARFGAALARCNDDHYARTGMGYVLLRAGAVDAAVAAWSAVVAAQPDNVDALTGLGLAAWRQGDVDAVRARFARVVELSPGHPTAIDYLARVSGSSSSVSAPADAADRAWAEGNTARALELYDARLREDPADEVALLRSALLTAWRGDYADALVRLERLLQRAPGHIDARLARARVRAWSGDVPRARRDVEEILAIDPDNVEALEALVLFQSWSGELDESLGTYDELIAIAPESSVASRMRAQALARASRFEASLSAYRALLATNPNDIEARLGLAQALAYAQDFDTSIAEYDRVLAASPAEARALLGKSRVLLWSGRLVEAERIAFEGVEVDGGAAAWSALGQVYRAQGRPADALEAFETATGLAPTDAEVLDQLRSVRLGLAPLARPTVVIEGDSDDNRMVTTSLAGGWHPAPRLDLQARAYRRDLEQGIFRRTAHGASVSGTYELSPGWRISAGVGGSRTDGTGTPTLVELQAGVRTPERHRIGGGVSFATVGLNETAMLAELGGRSTEVVVSARWTPTLTWRVDGSVGVGEIAGSEDNGRRSASLSTSLRLGSMFSIGAAFRGFSFEKNLFDGYFDPDFYGVGELTSHWLYRPGPWTLLVEVAPGVQQVGSDGDAGTSLRTNALVGYRFAPGRDVTASFGYSSAGLAGFRTGTSDYRYTALIIGSSWTF